VEDRVGIDQFVIVVQTITLLSFAQNKIVTMNDFQFAFFFFDFRQIGGGIIDEPARDLLVISVGNDHHVIRAEIPFPGSNPGQ
jgi:hypothetical protein